MVAGLDRFRDHFRAHSHQYVLIGGTACDLAMDELGAPFRATKDLDIVLIVEVLDGAFIASFWEFVRLGEYKVQQSSFGRPRYYRFAEPRVAGYPSMLELFSVKPDVLSPGGRGHLTPIPTDEGMSSLSAILLDSEYYSFLKSGVRTVEDVPIVGPEHLIPLKARAWLDLVERKEGGEQIDSRTIRKHKNDVFRLFTVIVPTFQQNMPELVRRDMQRFLVAMDGDPVDLRTVGIRTGSLDSVLDQLRSTYVGD